MFYLEYLPEYKSFALRVKKHVQIYNAVCSHDIEKELWFPPPFPIFDRNKLRVGGNQSQTFCCVFTWRQIIEYAPSNFHLAAHKGWNCRIGLELHASSKR